MTQFGLKEHAGETAYQAFMKFSCFDKLCTVSQGQPQIIYRHIFIDLLELIKLKDRKLYTELEEKVLHDKDFEDTNEIRI